MVINKSKVIIRPENPSEYGEVNKLIYEAFAEQHGIETGKFMMEQGFVGIPFEKENAGVYTNRCK